MNKLIFILKNKVIQKTLRILLFSIFWVITWKYSVLVYSKFIDPVAAAFGILGVVTYPIIVFVFYTYDSYFVKKGASPIKLFLLTIVFSLLILPTYPILSGIGAGITKLIR